MATKKLYEITTYMGDHLSATSGPFETRTSAERALTALFQSGRADNGRVNEIEVECEDEAVQEG